MWNGVLPISQLSYKRHFLHFPLVSSSLFHSYFHRSRKLLSLPISVMHTEPRKHPQDDPQTLGSTVEVLWHEIHSSFDFHTLIPDYKHHGTLGFIGTSVRLDMYDWNLVHLHPSRMLKWHSALGRLVTQWGLFSREPNCPFSHWATGGEW